MWYSKWTIQFHTLVIPWMQHIRKPSHTLLKSIAFFVFSIFYLYTLCWLDFLCQLKISQNLVLGCPFIRIALIQESCDHRQQDLMSPPRNPFRLNVCKALHVLYSKWVSIESESTAASRWLSNPESIPLDFLQITHIVFIFNLPPSCYACFWKFKCSSSIASVKRGTLQCRNDCWWTACKAFLHVFFFLNSTGLEPQNTFLTYEHGWTDRLWQMVKK